MWPESQDYFEIIENYFDKFNDALRRTSISTEFDDNRVSYNIQKKVKEKIIYKSKPIGKEKIILVLTTIE